MKSKINIIILLILGITTVQAQTINDYLKIAAKNNPGLQAQYKEFEASLQKVTQAGTLPDPNFSFGYFISPVETRLGAQRAKFSLNQMFPWFGTLKAQKDATALMAEAKYQSFLNARNQLFYKVAETYYPLYEINRQKQIEKENINILELYKTISNSKVKTGSASMVDVLRVDIMLEDSKVNLNIINEKEKALRTAFNKVLNRNKEEVIIIKDSLPSGIFTESLAKDSLLANNPMLEALNLKIKASETQQILAQKQGLPKIGVGLDYVLVDKRTDMNVPNNGRDVIMPMISVSIPLSRKKYNAAKKEAELMQESYMLQKAELENSLVSNYEMTLFQIDQQKQLLALYERQIKTTKQSLNLLFTYYRNSGKDFEEVLRMQQQLLKYQKMKASAETQYLIAVAKLNYITAKKYE